MKTTNYMKGSAMPLRVHIAKANICGLNWQTKEIIFTLDNSLSLRTDVYFLLILLSFPDSTHSTHLYVDVDFLAITAWSDG